MSLVLPSLRSPFLKRPLYSAIATLTMGFGIHAQAQPPALEEIIITSQKRPQSLQDVPISVAAITGDKIEAMGVQNLEDLTVFVPSLHYTETGFSTQVRIRGIGSDNSQGFEQSVGMYVDGIYHGRAQLFRAPIFDVERVEVMRGPQGTLFGKNSIAGALDLITAKPTDEFEGQILGSYETEFGTNEVSGYVSGPFSEKWKGRLAVRYYDDPGYMTNNFKGTDEANQEELAVRGSLDWQATDNFKALLIIEHDTFDVQGRAIEATLDKPIAENVDSFHEVLANFGPTFDPEFNYIRDMDAPEFSNNTIDSQTLRLDYNWNDYTVTALTGLLGFDYTENCDCDFTPANMFDLDLFEEYDQISQEIRIASPSNTTIEWVAGIYYQSYEQSFSDVFNIPTDSLFPTFLALNPDIPDTVETLRGQGIDRQFTQDSDSWAIFGEAVWNVTSDFSIALGARFTEEEKSSTKVLNGVDITNNNTPLEGVVGGTAAGLFKGIFAVDTEQLKLLGSPTGHNLDESRKESDVTPALTLTYYINDEIMTYAKASKGFKAGGFDPRSNNTAHFEFEEETVNTIELGSKMSLAEGQGELNIALFRMDYDNLQISQFDGALGFNIGNAKDTLVQGLELDGRWQLHEHLSSSFGFAYLDFEYKDFKNGNCHHGQAPDTIDPETGAGICDYTGKRGVYTPEYTINGSLDYRQSINSSMTFFSSLDLQWIDEQMVHVNLDPNGLIDAYTMLAMRVGVETDRWQLALLGQNLLDEGVISYSGNIPLSGSIAQSNTFYSFVRRPRTIALAGSFKF